MMNNHAIVTSLKRIGILAALTLLVGCGSSEEAPQVSDITRQGKPLVLELDGATLTLPADALPPDTEVGASVFDAVNFDPDAVALYETPVTLGLSLFFPGLAAADEPIIVELRVTQPVQNGIYGKLRTIGPGPTEGITDTGWQHTIGVYDEQAAAYRVAIGATTDRIALIVVTGTAAPNPQGLFTPPTGSPEFQWVAHLTSVLGIPAAHAQSEKPKPDIGKYALDDAPWAVVCHPQTLPGCNENSEALKKIADWAQTSTQSLAALGFKNAYLGKLTRKQISDSGFVFVPNRIKAGGDHFFVIEVRRNLNGDLGVYQPATASLIVIANADSTTVIHEMFHAVQKSESFRIWDRNWVIEATAAAVEPFAPDLPPGVAKGREYRYGGAWRTWGRHLAADDGDQGNVQYETAELWLNIDPALGYLPEFLSAMDTRSRQSAIGPHNEFQYVDSILQQTTGKGLREQWQDVLVDRNGADAYPYCSKRRVTCEGSECELLDPEKDIPRIPMVSACRDFEIEATDAECTDPSFDAKFEGSQEIHDFLVDGEWFEPGDETTLSSSTRVWLANSYVKGTSGQRENPPTPPKMTLRPRCLAVTRLRMEATISASAHSVQRKTGESHSEYYDRRLSWESGSEVEVKESLTRDGVEQGGSGGGAAHLDNVSFTKTVNASPAAQAQAELRVQTRQEDRDFIVDGNGRLEVKGGSSGNWRLSASASLDFALNLSIQKPSEVRIENCELFSAEPLLTKPGFRREGQTCSLWIEDPGGEPAEMLPQMDGTPEGNVAAALAADGLGFNDEEYEEMMELLESDDVLKYSSATAAQLEESKRLLKAMYGVVLTFVINQHRANPASDEEHTGSLNEAFSIHIRELTEDELDN